MSGRLRPSESRQDRDGSGQLSPSETPHPSKNESQGESRHAWLGRLRPTQLFVSLWRQRPSQTLGPFYGGRNRLIAVVFFGVFAVLAGRAVTIHILSPSADILETLGRRQYQTRIDLSPYRGNIYDRRGEPLAISIRRPSFYVNPRIFDPSPQQTRQLAQILEISPAHVRKVAKRTNYFAWLARKVELTQAQKVTALNIDGLFEITEPARFYPNGTDLVPLIGSVGIDNRGLQGVELAYDGMLKGEVLSTFRNRDARGQSIYRDSLLALPEKTGKNIVLTLDSAIQNTAQRALMKGIEKAKARGGFAIVSDPHTGRILAIANANTAPSEINRNRALTDIFEPGSVVKPLVIGRAVELGLTRMDEVHDTFNGTYHEDKWQIRDTHGAPSMSTEEILIESSNIGTYRIAKRMGPERLAQTLGEFGFGSRDNQIGFPGQTFGRVSPWQKWRPVRFANVAFGQGFYASGLEMVQAFGAIANGGNLMKPFFIDHIESPEGGMIESHASEIVRRVFSPTTASSLRHVLRKVVDEGTGSKAALTSWSSAGKTGTSEKVDPQTRKYSDHLRIASFIGFAPSVDPHLVIYVVVDEPFLKPYTGGTWAAPIFQEIAEETLRYLNVAPDKFPAKDALAKGTTDHLQKSESRGNQAL
ncbi:MAG TPA: penicillin-binding protein 2 [Oligoflexus sp.]|uniref:peptidoglycan D,D-transpeptidase FtsI family protein n=1 Tax=Oligoflexus sp. TaxID=1971216 RepID=UPI002D3DE215|nr:penicillin-binding protein 2 [Oligoflexus sp.]HYX35025.1 penicillin-binding protein 2 [Oligoflexus sp.]